MVNESEWENRKLSNLGKSWIKVLDNQWDDGSKSITNNIDVQALLNVMERNNWFNSGILARMTLLKWERYRNTIKQQKFC